MFNEIRWLQIGLITCKNSLFPPEQLKQCQGCNEIPSRDLHINESNIRKSARDGWKSLRGMTSLSKLKEVTVHILQLFCGMQDVSQEEPRGYLLSAPAKQVCACV